MAGTPSFALHAVASFFGRTVEETFARRGHALQIGNTDALSVPVPEDAPYIAKVMWTSPRAAKVVDGKGQMFLLGADEPVAIQVGDVKLELSLVPQVRHARFGSFSWGLSFAWFVVVVAGTVFSSTLGVAADVIEPRTCEILQRTGWMHPRLEATFQSLCVPPSSAASGVTAEYLARLLREDYAGEEDGLVAPEEREQSEKVTKEAYIPAGDEGPITKMGGAEKVSPKPERGQEEKSAAAPDALPEEQKGPEPIDDGHPTADQPAVEEGDASADAMGDDAEDTDADESSDAASEEEKGWGVRDWYDVQDERLEDMEIKIMLSHARTRLRIDPNDAEALSILSYYQYLGQDYDAAMRTYDKYIALFPEESAGYNNKALIYKRRGLYKQEEDLYRVALSLSPNDVTALNNLAVNLAHQKRYPEALAIMQQLEVLDPGEPYADLHRAKIYADMGQEEIAYDYLQKSLDGMSKLDTLHHIEFRQDIRLDPSFEQMRKEPRFHAIMARYYGEDTPVRP